MLKFFAILSALVFSLTGFARTDGGSAGTVGPYTTVCEAYPHLCKGTRTYRCVGDGVSAMIQVTAQGPNGKHVYFSSKTILDFRGQKSTWHRGKFYLGELPPEWKADKKTGWYFPSTFMPNQPVEDILGRPLYSKQSIKHIRYKLGNITFLNIRNGRDVYATHERGGVLHRMSCR